MNQHKLYRRLCLAFLLALCVALAGCGKKTASTVKAADATPEPLHFAAGDVAITSDNLHMTLASGETALLNSLTSLRTADFSGSQNEEEIAAWALSHPNVNTRYTVTLPNGRVLDSDTRSVDLSGMSPADCEAAARKLALLPALESVNLGAEGGALGWDDIARLRGILPAPLFRYAFKLYGLDCNLADTTINLYKVSVPDNGKLIDQVMDYMPQLTYVDMDSCGLQPARLEEINFRHPNAKVVFRVMFGDNYTARTDTERILASMASKGGMLNNDNVQGLYYCHDVKYLDLGHNTLMTNIGFCAQMPKLEVAILSMCNIRDLTPLASCPELEYLELSNTYADDLRPLSGLTKLRHLNVASIGYDFYGDGTRPSLKDISPLYSLTGLERLWVGAYNPVPASQIEEMHRRAPNCEIDTSVYEDPVGGHWRYLALADYINTYVDTLHERYIKLREQFGNYESSVYNFTWNDPLYDANYAVPVSTPTPTPSPTPTATPAAVYTPEPTYEPAVTPAPVYNYVPEEQYWESYEPYYEEPDYGYDPYYEEPAPQENTPYELQQPIGDLVFNTQMQDYSATANTEETPAEPAQENAETQDSAEAVQQDYAGETVFIVE